MGGGSPAFVLGGRRHQAWKISGAPANSRCQRISRHLAPHFIHDRQDVGVLAAVSGSVRTQQTVDPRQAHAAFHVPRHHAHQRTAADLLTLVTIPKPAAMFALRRASRFSPPNRSPESSPSSPWAPAVATATAQPPRSPRCGLPACVTAASGCGATDRARAATGNLRLLQTDAAQNAHLCFKDQLASWSLNHRRHSVGPATHSHFPSRPFFGILMIRGCSLIQRQIAEVIVSDWSPRSFPERLISLQIQLFARDAGETRDAGKNGATLA